MPTAIPQTISPNAPPRISRTASLRFAPSAILTPISVVRHPALYAVTPYIPIHANNRDRSPNKEVSRAISRCWRNTPVTCSLKGRIEISGRFGSTSLEVGILVDQLASPTFPSEDFVICGAFSTSAGTPVTSDVTSEVAGTRLDKAHPSRLSPPPSQSQCHCTTRTASSQFHGLLLGHRHG